MIAKRSSRLEILGRFEDFGFRLAGNPGKKPIWRIKNARLSRKDAKDWSQGQLFGTMVFFGRQIFAPLRECLIRGHPRNPRLFLDTSRHSFDAAGWKTCPTTTDEIE